MNLPPPIEQVDPKTPKSKLILSLVGVLVVFLAVPVAVYLVTQQTNFLPKADEPVPVIPSPSPLQPAPSSSSITSLQAPEAGSSAILTVNSPQENQKFNYNEPIDISWQNKIDSTSLASRKATTIDLITISLYMNNNFFGFLTKDSPNKNQFSWIPSQSLPYVYANNQSFQLEVSGTTESGQVVSSRSGNFSISSE